MLNIIIMEMTLYELYRLARVNSEYTEFEQAVKCHYTKKPYTVVIELNEIKVII